MNRVCAYADMVAVRSRCGRCAVVIDCTVALARLVYPHRRPTLSCTVNCDAPLIRTPSLWPPRRDGSFTAHQLSLAPNEGHTSHRQRDPTARALPNWAASLAESSAGVSEVHFAGRVQRPNPQLGRVWSTASPWRWLSTALQAPLQRLGSYRPLPTLN